MLPLKLLRSLVLGETINNQPHMIILSHHHHHHGSDDNDDYDNDDEDEDEHQHETRAMRMRRMRRRRRRKRRRSKTPGLLFLPTRELVTDTYRLATIARDLGMDLFPTPSLSHIIFSNPPPPLPTPLSSSSPISTPSSSTFPSTTTTTTTTCSFSSSSSSWLLQSDAVPIPFPSLASAPLTHLRHFVNLASPAFKLVFFSSGEGAAAPSAADWDCSSLSLYSRVTGERVDDMEGFCRVLAGKGWTFFKTQKRPPPADWRVSGGGSVVYLFRKVDPNRVRVGRIGGGFDGACRVRELRLPHLDFGNAPLRILQYILLMTDDIFCLA